MGVSEYESKTSARRGSLGDGWQTVFLHDRSLPQNTTNYTRQDAE